MTPLLNGHICEPLGIESEPSRFGDGSGGDMSTMVGQSLGQYQLVGFLGEGGVAYVYRARRINEKADVAIKILKPDILNSVDFTRRLKREALVGASLKHPHILNVISYGQHGSTVYIVMPLLTGGSLADLFQRKNLDIEEICCVIEYVASGLDYLHERGIVHRDVKLENILLDDTGSPVLSDLGMVKALTDASHDLFRRARDSRQSTRKGLVFGTPGYMSPEQCRSQPIDSRSDIYSLGVVLFELLTGELPFKSESSIEAMYMHITKPPPAVTSVNSRLPADLDAVVERALAKDPEKRFPSAGELAKAVRSALNQASQESRMGASTPVKSRHTHTARATSLNIGEPASASRHNPLEKRPTLPVLCALFAVVLTTVLTVGVLLAVHA